MKQALALALSFAALLGLPDAFAAEPGRPNILIVMTDDLGYHDLGCQGAKDMRTPNLDRLAASGVRFTDGYVTSPQCGPSRAALMTGISPHRFGYINNDGQNGLPADDHARTLPEQLKALGYVTGIVGKWHIGFRAKDGHSFLPGNHPWEQGFDFTLTHDSGMSHYYPYREDGTKWMTSRDLEYRLRQKLETEPAPRFLDGLPADTYLTDYFSEQAARFVSRSANKPWFLFLAYNAPHTPCVAKADKLQKYAQVEDKRRRHLLAMMESVDDGVGRVLSELERTGQTGRTLVWFLSDNGAPTHENGSRNDPFSGLKGDVFEGGIRVPFILSWPGAVPAGKALSEPVISLDILPTSLAAAGLAEIPKIHEGRNLLPWLKGEAPHPHDKLFWLWCSRCAVRRGSLKETRNGAAVKAADGSAVPAHVFSDLRENPGERAERALQNPEQRKTLAAELDAWLAQIAEDAKRLTPKVPNE